MREKEEECVKRSPKEEEVVRRRKMVPKVLGGRWWLLW